MAAEQRFAWKGTDRHGKAVDGIMRAVDASDRLAMAVRALPCKPLLGRHVRLLPSR